VDIGLYETGTCVPAPFKRGDANADGSRSIADAIALLEYLFRTAAVPPCLDAADANDDGRITVSDAVGILNLLFGTVPPQDFGALSCTVDATPDELPPCVYEWCTPQVFPPEARYLGQVLVFCIDRSSSMGQPVASGQTKFELTKRFVADMIRGLSLRTRASIVFYNRDQGPLVCGDPPVPMTAEGKAELLGCLLGTPISSGSCLLRGVLRALEIAAAADPPLAARVILIGDGRTHCPNGEADPERIFQSILAHNVHGIPIDTVYVGADGEEDGYVGADGKEDGYLVAYGREDWNRGESLLERIARATGGTFTLAW
jgi:hypothetical protein